MTKQSLVSVANTAQKSGTKTTPKEKPVKSVADKLRDLQKLQKLIEDYEKVQTREAILNDLLNGANDEFITLELTITNGLENYNSPKKEITFTKFEYIKDSMQVMHKSMSDWLSKTKTQINDFEV